MTTAPAAAPPYVPAGTTSSRIGRWKIVLFALVGLAIVVVVANVVVLIGRSGPAQPDCQPDQACLPQREPAALGQRWTSSELGFSFEYPPDWLQVVSQDGRSVHLQIPTNSFESELWVSGVPASEASVDQLVQQRRDALAQRVVGLQEDNDSPDRIVSPSLGYVHGVGGSYSGTLDSGSGPSAPATVAIIAAGDGKVNVVLSLVLAGNLDHSHIQNYRIGSSRLVLNTMRWR
ncbi:MAG TPA: hypothetical protein VEP49_09620 [Acidimicrobiia bacterium]|nr:hypothetical protein [Acidimicrobiia bacterium]